MFDSLLLQSFNQGFMIVFKTDKAGDYAVPNVLGPRDLVFRLDICCINWTFSINSIISICYTVIGMKYVIANI